MPRLPEPPDGRFAHRAAAEGDSRSRARALHAVQGLLYGARVSIQAKPPSRSTDDQDFSAESSFHVVAGGFSTEILVVRRATRWLRLNGYPRTIEQSLHRM